MWLPPGGTGGGGVPHLLRDIVVGGMKGYIVVVAEIEKQRFESSRANMVIAVFCCHTSQFREGCYVSPGTD